MLPLFAYLAQESRNWKAPKPEQSHLNDWWKNEDWQNECNPVGKKTAVLSVLIASLREVMKTEMLLFAR
jgi:hypothetical protein